MWEHKLYGAIYFEAEKRALYLTLQGEQRAHQSNWRVIIQKTYSSRCG